MQIIFVVDNFLVGLHTFEIYIFEDSWLKLRERRREARVSVFSASLQISSDFSSQLIPPKLSSTRNVNNEKRDAEKLDCLVVCFSSLSLLHLQRRISQKHEQLQESCQLVKYRQFYVDHFCSKKFFNNSAGFWDLNA